MENKGPWRWGREGCCTAVRVIALSRTKMYQFVNLENGFGPIFLGTPLKPLVDHHGSSSILVKRCHLKRWPDFCRGHTCSHLLNCVSNYNNLKIGGQYFWAIPFFLCGANQLVWGGFMMIMAIWAGAKGIIIWIYVYNDLYRCCFFKYVFIFLIRDDYWIYIYTHTLW